MNKSDLQLDWCTHEAAKYAVEKWHYSGTLPACDSVKCGVWELRRFVGVVIFSRGASPPMFTWGAKTLGLAKTEMCELSRIALAQHEAAVSRVVAIAIRMLKKACPRLRLVVSYADADEGHHGGIYQAGGWLYCGESNVGGRQGFMIRGRKVHCRSMVSIYGENSLGMATAIDKNATEIFTLGKRKYLMPLDAEMRARIQPLAKPYPKRARSADSGTPVIQAGRGSANLTGALCEPIRSVAIA